jgi:hypothetical protein
MKVIGKRTRGYDDALKAFILTLYLERYLNFDLLDNQEVELVSRSGLQIGALVSEIVEKWICGKGKVDTS